jgi:hypothetical protein
MKKKLTANYGFLNLRVLIALLIALTGVTLALLGFGTFAVGAASTKQQAQSYTTTNSIDPLVPPVFDCSKIHELGIDKQVNVRARAIMIACGQAEGRSSSGGNRFSQWMRNLLPAPLTYGGTDVDLITGAEIYPNVNQSTTFSAINPDNPQQIVIGYNDSRGTNAIPFNFSGASVSTDGGTTFTRLTYNDQSPFGGTGGDPVVLYNRPTGTWYTVWLDQGCGGGGLGGYKSTTPWDPSPASWTHYCVHSGSQDDWESGWADNNTASPFYGRMYVCWNDFARGGGDIFVRYSTDNGNSWTNEQQVVTNTFIRKAQITGDLVTGDLYIAGINEGGGGFAPRSNLIFRSTDGGATWTNTYTGPTFFGPGRNVTGYFVYMYSSPAPAWVYMGWGQPAAINHVVHYVYTQCGQNVACDTATDHGDVYYIRSTDSGVTFGTPVKLNTDTGTATQWEPNLSVSPSGTVFAVWYDERTGGACTPGANTPCYQMFARKSTDNGVSWQPDMAFSDVVSPLSEQPYSLYDYQVAVATSHRTGWVDGRVAINGIQQQDAFTDSEPSGASTPTPTATATVTATATATATATPTPMPRPTQTPRPRPTPAPRP